MVSLSCLFSVINVISCKTLSREYMAVTSDGESIRLNTVNSDVRTSSSHSMRREVASVRSVSEDEPQETEEQELQKSVRASGETEEQEIEKSPTETTATTTTIHLMAITECSAKGESC